MLTTPLLLLSLSQVPVVGEVGESCRSDRDCEASLACVQSVCAVKARALPAKSVDSVPAAPPLPVLPPRTEPKPAEVAPSEGVTESVVVPETPGQFNGVHFIVGASGGAGPFFVHPYLSVFEPRAFRTAQFLGAAARLPLELKVGVTFGRFELALEGSPSTTVVTGTKPSLLSSVSLSAGWMFRLHESGEFGVYLPARLRAGAIFQYGYSSPGGAASASIGVGLRWGRFMLEARAGVEVAHFTADNFTWDGVSIPFSVAPTFFF